MKLEEQCCSLELAKRLKELNVKQESLWFYYQPYVCHDSAYIAGPNLSINEAKEREKYKIASAFTVAELGEMLLAPQSKRTSTLGYRAFKDVHNLYVCGWDGEIDFSADSEADARGKMLCYLLENKLIKAENLLQP